MEDLIFKGHLDEIPIKNAKIIKLEKRFIVTFSVQANFDHTSLVKKFYDNKMPPLTLRCSLGDLILSLVEYCDLMGNVKMIFIDLS